jgi:hypothetical protein
MWISNDQLHDAFKRAKLSCQLSLPAKATPMCTPLLTFRPSFADGWSTNHVLVNTTVSVNLTTTTAAAKALRGNKRGAVVKPLHTLTIEAVLCLELLAQFLSGDVCIMT